MAERTRGTGSLVKKAGSKNWYAVWWQNGRQHCVSTGTDSKMVAEGKLREHLSRKDCNEQPLPDVRKLRYEALRDELVKEAVRQGHKSLYKGHDTRLKHLDEFFKGRRVAAIRPNVIRDFSIARQKAGDANGTINRSLSALKRMFSLAKADGLLADIPRIEMLKEAPPRSGFFEYEEYRRLRQELPEHLRPVLALGYYSGMRLGEIRTLKWECVSFADKTIRLNPGETKNDESRVLYLTPELLEMLKLLQQKNPGAIFVFGATKPLGSFRKAWESACQRAKLGRKVLQADGSEAIVYPIFHDLRRTALRNLVRRGVSEKAAMAISGHKTRSIFDRYNIVDERDLSTAAAKVAEYYAAEEAALQAKEMESNHGLVESSLKVKEVLQ